MRKEDYQGASNASRDAAGRIVVGLGLLVLLSGAVINPWVGQYYRVDAFNVREEMLIYFSWSMALGVLSVGSGYLLQKTSSRLIQNLVVLIVTCACIVLLDRLLLAKLRLPLLWVSDMELHYKHRPDIVRSWGPKYDNKLIYINSYGHHDDEFPEQKPEGEFRGLMLGDSITMGHGVHRSETFSTQLEQILATNNSAYTSYQMINTGVQGYSTFQEYHVLRRSLRFEPDFIAVGFCMNDLTEPFRVNRDFGGLGVDYHGVSQVSNLVLDYLINETGFGRLVNKMHAMSTSAEAERMKEQFGVEYMARHSSSDPKLLEQWVIVLSYLDEIYATAREADIPVVILIFPHTFQFLDSELKRPQALLAEHASKRGVDVIDLAKVFENLIFNKASVAKLRQQGYTTSEILERYEYDIRRYFLDADHYTPTGHRIVAYKLAEYLSSRVLPSTSGD
jgi:hypothetical protein